MVNHLLPNSESDTFDEEETCVREKTDLMLTFDSIIKVATSGRGHGRPKDVEIIIDTEKMFFFNSIIIYFLD